jgi:hypothetical protein
MLRSIGLDRSDDPSRAEQVRIAEELRIVLELAGRARVLLAPALEEVGVVGERQCDMGELI